MENLRAKDLLFYCFDSLGVAYLAAQKATDSIEIMEIFPLGAKGHIVFFAEESLQNFANEIQADFGKKILHSKLVHQCSAKVLKSYFSVENSPLEQSFVIFESAFIGDLVSIANESVENDLRIVDLRLLRGSAASASLFLTGTDENVKNFILQVKASSVHVTVISKPSAKVRDFFAIQP